MSRLTERQLDIRCARVYIAQARAFRRRHPAFADTLLQWAANARRRAYRANRQLEIPL